MPTVVDDRAFQLALDRMLARVQVASKGMVTDAAHLIEAAAKQHTPVRSGTLRRSEHTEPGGFLGGVYSARVGPSTVYARRIELGFHGPDSLGRVYHQRGEPYLKPGVRDAMPGIRTLVARSLTAAIRG